MSVSPTSPASILYHTELKINTWFVFVIFVSIFFGATNACTYFYITDREHNNNYNIIHHCPVDNWDAGVEYFEDEDEREEEEEESEEEIC